MQAAGRRLEPVLDVAVSVRRSLPDRVVHAEGLHALDPLVGVAERLGGALDRAVAVLRGRVAAVVTATGEQQRDRGEAAQERAHRRRLLSADQLAAAGVHSASRCLIPLMKFDCRRVRLADRSDVGHPPEQLLEHHRDLAPGQVGAEAEVRSRTAEAEVVVRRAAEVEA